MNLKHFNVLNYPSEKIIEFAFISRIMKEKGIDQYLEATEYIRSKYSNIRFHICGFCEEDYEEKLMKLQEKGIVEYTWNAGRYKNDIRGKSVYYASYILSRGNVKHSFGKCSLW